MIDFKTPYGTFTTLTKEPEGEHYIKLNQVHSSKILTLDQYLTDPQAQADAIIVNKKDMINFTPVIKTADCLPVVILSDHHVTFVHAGWRGLAQEILLNPMIASLKPHYAYIGPSIHREHFEVQEDFKQAIPLDQFYHCHEGKLYFDLQAYATDQLKQHYGCKVDICPVSTFDTPSLFSFRRDQTVNRNWNIFSLSV